MEKDRSVTFATWMDAPCWQARWELDVEDEQERCGLHRQPPARGVVGS